MSNKEIIEGNKLIAEFMAVPFQIRYDCSDFLIIYDNEHPPHGYFDADELLFHTSWDWLMPVVEKIEGLNYDFQIIGTHVIVVNSENGYEYDDMSDSKIDAVWQAVVQFIKWYKTQKP